MCIGAAAGAACGHERRGADALVPPRAWPVDVAAISRPSLGVRHASAKAALHPIAPRGGRADGTSLRYDRVVGGMPAAAARPDRPRPFALKPDARGDEIIGELYRRAS